MQSGVGSAPANWRLGREHGHEDGKRPRALGTTRSWIVHGEKGLDEIGLAGKTIGAEINGLEVKRFEIEATDFGVRRLDRDLPTACSSMASAEIIRRIFENEIPESDAEKLVLINAAAAIYITGSAATLSEAYEKAEDSVRTGAASDKLNKLVAESTK